GVQTCALPISREPAGRRGHLDRRLKSTEEDDARAVKSTELSRPGPFRHCEDITQYAATMRIVIAGGHGKIALRLAAKLAERGDRPVALIHKPVLTQDVEAVDRKSTRLNSSHVSISYAVFC